MDFKKSTYYDCPNLVEVEGREVKISFDSEMKEVVVGNNVDDKTKAKGAVETIQVFEAYVVRVEQPLGYDKVVNAIVSAAYPSDKMQAIINNHLLDSEEDEDYKGHTEEFNTMQQWRKHAKEVAKDVISWVTEK